MNKNSHCGPDIVKYFVVEPANDVVTGATGNFFVCSGTTFLKTISGCTDSVDFNGNTFYNNSDVFFNGVITACTGIHTSNIYGCSPITVHDELILLNKLTLSAVTQDDTLTQILGRDSSTGEVKYRDVSSIAPAAKLQNTYFVSSLSGDNSTALVGDINNPWKTITEARNQAVSDGLSNSLIHVYSGEYFEDEIQYENGNFYFEPNSKVITQRTTSGGTTSIFKLGTTLVYASNAYSANTCNVYGYGDFSVSATTDTDAYGGVVLSMLGDSNSYFEFNDAYVHSGVGFYAGGNSTLTLEGHDILLDPSGSDGLDFGDSSTTLINVNDIVGGNSHFNIHYRTYFAGKSVVNFNKLIGSDQLVGFDQFMQPTAEITMNFNLIEHTGGSQFIINSGNNLGGTITLNGDFYAPYGNGILSFNDYGEYNINGNITCRDTALLSIDALPPGPFTNFVLNYNGDIITSGITSDFGSNGGIQLNKITANLNGSLTNLSLGSLSNGINIDDNSILTIDNFDINVVSGNSIGTSSSNVVNIKHSLSINKPFSSGITTTGLYNYTGTTNVGDLVIYNTPELNNSATDILVRNSSTGNVEYRDSSTVIPTAKLQNTYFVSSLSGDNSTALVGDINSPWETITSARNQVVSDGFTNSLIHVYSGQYVDEEIQYENGNFYFEPNSIVTMSPTLGANASALFKLGSTPTKVSNIYSATTCNVYGYGIFVVSASTDGGIGGTVLDLESNSVSSFEFDIINIENGLGINSKDVSTLHLEGNDIIVDITADCIALQQGSKHIINVNKVVGGSGHWGFHYSNYSGTSLVNISEILGKPSFQPIGFSNTKDGAEIVVNFNKLSHEPVGAQFVINNSNQQGGKITLNGNIEAQRGIVYGQTCTGGEFNYNGDIIVNEYPIFNSFTGPHNGNTFFYNGNIISNGNNGNGSILLKGGTSILNGSLTNNTFTGNTNGVSIASDPTDLKIGNFDINVNTESITSSSPQTVEILHSLSINNPLGSNITTTGLFNYTGTTNVGDLVIYNTPTNDNSLTQILARNTDGLIKYVDVNSIITGATTQDTFVTGFTFNDSTYDLTISQNNGESDLVSNLAVLASDVYVVSGIYNPSTGIVTYTNSSGGTFQVSGFTTGMTDSYTTDAYISGSEIRFDNNIQGANYYNVDLNPLLSGKTDNTTFNTYTANTQTILDGKIDSANNVGGANEFFKDKSGTTLNFRTLSGGSNTTVSTVGDVVKVDVTIPTDTNTFVTGFTYNNANTFTIFDNVGDTFSASVNEMTGLTVNGSVSATTYFGDGSNLSGITTTDTFVTGGTINSGTLTLERQNGIVTITGLTSSDGTSNEIQITDNSGGFLASVIEQSGTHIIPTTDSVTNLGSATNRFDNLYLDTIVNVDGALNFYSNDAGTNLEFSIGTSLITVAGGNNFRIQNGYMYFTGTNDRIGSTVASKIYLTNRQSSLRTGNMGEGYGFVMGNGIETAITPDSSAIFKLESTTQGFLPPVMTGAEAEAISTPTEGLQVYASNAGSGDITSFGWWGYNGSNWVKGFSSGGTDTNTFVTGFTYNDNNTFTIFDNDGDSFSATINQVSGLTVNGALSATTYFGDGSNLTGISTDDNYVTGGTFSTNTLTLNRQNGSVTITGFTSDSNTFVTGFTYNDANTFTISDNVGSAYTASINTMTGLTINGESTGTSLTVNGQSVFSGTVVQMLYKSMGLGQPTPLFRVEGSSGELFSITDSLIGELFAVNDISGIPILQVYSDDRIILGSNLAPSLYTTAKVTANSGSLTSIYSVPVSAYTGAWFEYTAKGTTSLRAGNIASIFSGTSVSHNETTTTDIGDTSDLLLDVIISGTSATLTASATTSNWEIKTIIRSI